MNYRLSIKHQLGEEGKNQERRIVHYFIRPSIACMYPGARDKLRRQ